MVDMVVRYTNDCIQPVLERFAPVLENGKSLYFRLVDHIDIKAVFGILYLHSAFHLNMRNTQMPCHGIDFILSASSLRLMISQHATID